MSDISPGSDNLSSYRKRRRSLSSRVRSSILLSLNTKIKPKFHFMDFQRPTGIFGGTAKRWIDKNLPRCPLCKSEPLWEVGFEGFAFNRMHFRCPKCLGIISVPPGGVEIPWTFTGATLKELALETIRVESIGNNKALDYLVGKVFRLTTLQDWASGKSSP